MNRVQKIKKLKAGFKFYKNSFHLHPPYLILCDSNFLYAVIDSKIQLEETFKSVFKGQIYLKVSNCALHELDLIKAPKCPDTKRFAYNKCQRFNCNHKIPKKPSSCIYQALKQGFHGCVCTQDSDLRRKIHRDFPKTPVFFVSNQSMVILPPPKSLKEKIKNELIAKYAPQALKKENAEPQDDIDDESSDNELVEEEEEEFEDINEDQPEITNSNNEEKKKKYNNIDVLQNFDENEENSSSIKQEEEKIDNDNQNFENDQTKRKRKHRHTVNCEQNEQIISENAEDVDNFKDVSHDTDIAQNDNDDSDNKKHKKKRHHHAKPDNEN